MKTLRLFCKWFIIIFSVVLFVLVSAQKRPMGMEEKDYDETDVDVCIEYLMKNINPYLAPLSNTQYKAKIDNLLSVYNYKEFIVDLGWAHKNGFSAILLNRIYIDDDVSGISYAITLTHELLHYQHYNTNERYIEFMTFKLLYESNDPHLFKASIIHAYSCITTTSKDEYWCADLIIDYLIKEKIC